MPKFETTSKQYCFLKTQIVINCIKHDCKFISSQSLIKYSFFSPPFSPSLALGGWGIIVNRKGSHLGSQCTPGFWHKLAVRNTKSQISTLFLLSLTFNGFSARMIWESKIKIIQRHCLDENQIFRININERYEVSSEYTHIVHGMYLRRLPLWNTKFSS